MYNVLVVDDEQGILDGFKKLIPWNEYGIEEIITATSGEEALQILSHLAVDILITDVRMEGMNGIELIRQVKKLYPDVKNMIQSGYDDFQYVKEAMGLGIENYLLKPVDEEELIGSLVHIQAKIEQEVTEKHQKKMNADIIRENVLLRWINDNITSSELETKSDTLQISLNDEMYFTVILGIQDLSFVKNTKKRTDVMTQGQLMERLLQESRKSLKEEAYLFHNLHQQVVAICHGDEEKASGLKQSINEMLRKMNKLYETDFFGVMGDVVYSHKEVAQSYHNAQHLIHIKGHDKVNQLVEWQMNKSTKNEFEKRFLLRFDEVEEHIKALDEVETEKILNRFHEEILQNNVFGSCWEKVVLQQLVMTVISCVDLQEHKELVTKVETLLMQIQYGEEKSHFEKIQTIHQLAKDTIHFLRDREANYSPLISEIVTLIQEGYDQDLNLSLIARWYKLNPVYLGQLFKNEVGDYFSGYLNNLRIKQAKYYLSQTEKSVTEIGTQVGYASKTHFFSVFKKMTGVTPSEFRRKRMG